jgi:transcriptional regulator GlxA family with amidase domain
MTMLKIPSSGTAAAELALESGTATQTISTYLQVRTLSADAESRRPDHVRPCPSEQLAKLLADAQTEFDRLHSVTQRAGFKIIFRDPNGIIIDYSGNAANGASAPHVRGGLAPSALRRVREYVEANLEGRIELTDLAAVANLSRCHFACAFKQSLGCTPHRYVMSRRLEKARHLLKTSDLPIVEIALATGFADQSHFSRCFRAFFGASPMVFRRSRCAA